MCMGVKSFQPGSGTSWRVWLSRHSLQLLSQAQAKHPKYIFVIIETFQFEAFYLVNNHLVVKWPKKWHLWLSGHL